MSTESLMAKLGPKVARIPAGEKRVNPSLMTGAKTMGKVRAAMQLATIGGVEASTRVHGSQTQSMDYDQLTPQDVAAALGFIADPLAREVFCLARWPGYAERDVSETRVLILRRVMDEGQRRQDEAITAWLQVELSPTRDNRAEADRRAREKWPARLCMYPRMVDLAMLHLDGSGLPECESVAKALRVARSKYYANWRDAMQWIHSELTTMARSAEGQFRAALKSP
jgi:hypothetical protein